MTSCSHGYIGDFFTIILYAPFSKMHLISEPSGTPAIAAPSCRDSSWWRCLVTASSPSVIRWRQGHDVQSAGPWRWSPLAPCLFSGPIYTYSLFFIRLILVSFSHFNSTVLHKSDWISYPFKKVLISIGLHKMKPAINQREDTGLFVINFDPLWR
jgi:hypothetical protein